MVIMAIGLIGIAKLQITSNVYTESGLHRSQASSLALEIFERMRVNTSEAKAGSYDIIALPTSTTNCEGSDAECTPTQIKDHDLRAWSSRITTLLPGADASITTSPDNGKDPVDITITIEWDQSRGQRPAVSEAFTFRLMGLDS